MGLKKPTSNQSPKRNRKNLFSPLLSLLNLYILVLLGFSSTPKPLFLFIPTAQAFVSNSAITFSRFTVPTNTRKPNTITSFARNIVTPAIAGGSRFSNIHIAQSCRRTLRFTMADSMQSNVDTEPYERKRVAIVGGGAAGLATARAFLHANEEIIKSQKADEKFIFDVTVFETRHSIGGIWRYDDESNGDAKVTSENSKTVKKSRPMYRNLRTNLPKELMAFREYPWGEGKEGGNDDDSRYLQPQHQSYVTHRQVLKYLEGYAQKFDLLRYINFGCKVTQLTALPSSNSGDESLDSNEENGQDIESWPKFLIEWSSSESNDDSTSTIQQKTFDAVCICNGHYALPSCPPLEGLNHFQGQILHAIEYDDPDQFSNCTVLCIGARASGADIAREIGMVARKVYLSDSTCNEMVNYGNVILMPRTQWVDENGMVHFSPSSGKEQNGDQKEHVMGDIDTIIFCSGYDYDFPFINENSNIDVKFQRGERRVQPLYEQLWHAKNPSLSFIGLPHSVVPFPLFELQAKAVVSQLLLSGGLAHSIDFVRKAMTLPSLSERILASEHDASSGGPDLPGRLQDTHYLGSHQWDYCRRMAKIAGTYDASMENFIATNKALYDKSGKERKQMTPGGDDTYRETTFRRDDDNQTFQIISSKLPQKETKVP